MQYLANAKHGSRASRWCHFVTFAGFLALPIWPLFPAAIAIYWTLYSFCHNVDFRPFEIPYSSHAPSYDSIYVENLNLETVSKVQIWIAAWVMLFTVGAGALLYLIRCNWANTRGKHKVNCAIRLYPYIVGTAVSVGLWFLIMKLGEKCILRLLSRFDLASGANSTSSRQCCDTSWPPAACITGFEPMPRWRCERRVWKSKVDGLKPRGSLSTSLHS